MTPVNACNFSAHFDAKKSSLSLQIALMDFKFNINHGAPGCEQHTRRPTHFDSVPADGE